MSENVAWPLKYAPTEPLPLWSAAGSGESAIETWGGGPNGKFVTGLLFPSITCTVTAGLFMSRFLT